MILSELSCIYKGVYMRFLTWNCNKVFRNKSEVFKKLKPNFAIIQEAEYSTDIFNCLGNYNCLWIGDNQKQGVLIICDEKYNLKVNSLYDKKYQYVIPVDVYLGEDLQFNMIAVWTKNNEEDRSLRYIGQVAKSLEHYGQIINNKTLLLGDFNWNILWDKDKKSYNFEYIVKELEKSDVHSCYHFINKLMYGDEPEATFYMHKNYDKRYHIDYIFAGKYFMDKITKVEVGKYDNYIGCSDHVPVIADFNL